MESKEVTKVHLAVLSCITVVQTAPVRSYPGMLVLPGAKMKASEFPFRAHFQVVLLFSFSLKQTNKRGIHLGEKGRCPGLNLGVLPIPEAKENLSLTYRRPVRTEWRHPCSRFTWLQVPTDLVNWAAETRVGIVDWKG